MMGGILPSRWIGGSEAKVAPRMPFRVINQYHCHKTKSNGVLLVVFLYFIKKSKHLQSLQVNLVISYNNYVTNYNIYIIGMIRKIKI